MDAQGGLSVGLSAKTKGWAGLGLVLKRWTGPISTTVLLEPTAMAVFSEQSGKGHRHADSGKVTVDKSVVTQVGDTTVLEFHIPADKLPFSGKTVAFIAASGRKG